MCGVVAKIPVRTGLRARDPERPHLGEHAIGLELETPAGHLADAPRDRACRQPVED